MFFTHGRSTIAIEIPRWESLFGMLSKLGHRRTMYQQTMGNHNFQSCEVWSDLNKHTHICIYIIIHTYIYIYIFTNIYKYTYARKKQLQLFRFSPGSRNTPCISLFDVETYRIYSISVYQWIPSVFFRRWSFLFNFIPMFTGQTPHCCWTTPTQ